MRRRLLRLGKGKAAWESGDIEQLMKRDFRDRDGQWDLRPSVYEVAAPSDAEQRAAAVRLVAEHSASFLAPFNKAAPVMDIEGVRTDVRVSLGGTGFSYANAMHREVVLKDEDDLRGFVATLLVERMQREQPMEIIQILEHIAANAESPEWVAAAGANEKTAKWVAEARKRVARG